MGTPNVSIRKHIRKLPGEATEPTSTLVLTSHESFFLDIRILYKTWTRPNGSTFKALPMDGEPIWRLEWAFAGKSYTTLPKMAGGPKHTVWCHAIDSQTSHPEKDEGDMYEQEDGDVLECGQNVDAKTGEIKKYEELWHDVGVEHVGQDKDYVSIVMMAADESRDTKGMIVRVGGWCQGILKVGKDTTVERWRWIKAEMWRLEAKLGHADSLMCESTFRRASLKLGDVIPQDNLDWKVVELYSWI